MRLLFWQESHPTVRGGAESWLNDTVKALRQRENQVAWLCSSQIQEAVDSFKPEVVIMGTLHCFVGLQHVGWLADQKIPAIWMMHDYWPFCGPRMLLQKLNQSDEPCEAVNGFCRNSCGGWVDLSGLVNRFHVVTGCKGAAAIMRRSGINVRGVVEEGVDTRLFWPGALERDRSKTVYASASGKDMWKGFHVLEEAAQAGGMELRLATGITRKELADWLMFASVYAFPSVYEEIWGLALTEAMASGCAVVASDVAGARAQIHEEWGNGILVPPGDPVALRQALEDVFAHPEDAAEMGKRAREHVVKEHSLEAIGKRWEAVCNTVKEENKCTAR